MRPVSNISTVVDVVKWVDPDTASLPSAPLRRILVYRRVYGVERRLYDMPWRTHPKCTAPPPFNVVHRAPRPARRSRSTTEHLENAYEPACEAAVFNEAAPSADNETCPEHEEDERRPSALLLTPPP